MPSPLDVSTALAAVRARGLRLSGPRRLVIEALFAAAGPVTAEQVARGRLPLGSVYRNLEALQAIGLVDRVSVGGSAALFAVRGARPAAVASCERCGARSEIDLETVERLRRLVREACGLRDAFAHGAVTGLCVACASRETL